MRQLLAAALAAIAMSACVTTAPPPAGAIAEPPPRVGGTCNAEAARHAIGKAGSEEVVDAARRDSGAALVRVVRPGMAVTADYRADRVTITVNDRGAITGIACG